MEKKFKYQSKGITLIALIVTIIVLLILAGVSIAVLTGENGILNRATSAKTTNEQKTAEEELKLGVSALSIDYRKNTTNSQTFREFVTSESGAKLKTAMGLAVDNQNLVVENATNGVVSYKGQQYQINDYGEIKNYTPISILAENESGVGYYIQKGEEYAIVFADRLAQEGISEPWSNYLFNFPSLTTLEKEKFKTYVISDEEYTDPITISDSTKGFGTHKVIKLAENNIGTEDRFIAMALSNVDENITRYDWYNAANNNSGRMTDFSSIGGDEQKGQPTSIAFGKGKINTQIMITKWNSKEYGEQDVCQNHKDLWGKVQIQFEKGWFVPSKEEWIAFRLAIKQNKFVSNDYTSLGLDAYYWTSSQADYNSAWAMYNSGEMDVSDVTSSSNNARLATLF